MSYQKILVPFDGSRYAKKALDSAVQIARDNNGIIYLCTIIDVTSVVPPGSLLGLTREKSGDLHKKLLSSALMHAENMQSQQIKYCKSKGVQAYQKIVIGKNASEKILDVAKKKQIDLIVIGSQGLHGIAKCCFALWIP
ncbi:MAG: universal stress protein [Nitrosopumilaceae archaeon]|nr:universal stress protein [Nitrosopumilaceae archaeon]